MIELPEAAVLANQLNKQVKGRKILRVIAAHSPHKFAWYHGNPKNYQSILKDKIINNAIGIGGMVEIRIDNSVLVLSDGATLRYHYDNKQLPKKHQLLIELDNSSAYTCYEKFHWHNTPLQICTTCKQYLVE